MKLHQKLDIELTALRDKYNRLARAHNELVVRVARIEGAPAQPRCRAPTGKET